MNEFPISKIGPGQLIDVGRSGVELHSTYARTCTVLQGDPPISDIRDTVPHRIASVYGGTWEDWNRHFVIQVSGCPLKCWYCYVDNFEQDKMVTAQELVEEYARFRDKVPDLNVLHFMGGCPGRYAHVWPEIRDCLDHNGLENTVLLSDVILVEHWVYGVKPWLNVPHRTLLSVCLKGTNFHNFLRNTGMDLFAQSILELWEYMRYQYPKQIYYTLIEWDPGDREFVERLLGPDRVDWLEVKEYEVVKRRMA